MRIRTLTAALILASLTLVPQCATRRPASPVHEDAAEMAPSAAAAAAPIPTASPADAGDPFRASIRPVLSTRCAPCHEPGGKMYARLPFDDSKVVSSNSAAILRRLKGDDRAALEKWIAGLAADPGAR